MHASRTDGPPPFVWFTGGVLLTALAMAPGPTAAVAEPPPLSPEVTVDHGFRYPDLSWDPERCAIGLGSGHVLLTAAQAWGGGVFGYRRTTAGAEVDANRVPLAAGAQRGTMGSFALSGPDLLGWKLAALTDWPDTLDSTGGARGLVVRSLDPGSLAPVAPDLPVVSHGSSPLAFPEMTWNGSRHLLAWIDADRHGVQLVRVTPDLGLLDPTPLCIADSAAVLPAGLAVRTGGGLVAWIDERGRPGARPLDADGAAAGPPRLMADSGGPCGQIATCRLGAGWLIAWTAENPRFQILDAQGAPSLPGAALLPGGLAEDGLAVCPSDSAALIVWREELSTYWSKILACRVDAGGTILDRQPIALWEGVHHALPPGVGHDTRTIACAWTGTHFVVQWS